MLLAWQVATRRAEDVTQGPEPQLKNPSSSLCNTQTLLVRRSREGEGASWVVRTWLGREVDVRHFHKEKAKTVCTSRAHAMCILCNKTVIINTAFS